MRLFAWMVAFACTYLALFISFWASECRGAWKRIHTARRETAIIWQREKLRRGLAELRERKP
jgi:hypothetical protein